MRDREIRALISQGQYAEALTAAEALVVWLPGGFEHLTEASAVAVDALVEARWRSAIASPETLSIARRVADWRHGRANDVRTASSLVGLGQVLLLSGRSGQAAEAFQAGLNAESPPGTSGVAADALEGLAAALIELTEYERAEHAVSQALSIRNAGADRRSLAHTFELQSLVLMRTGRYREARVPLDSALAIRETEPNHPDAPVTRALEGDLLWFEGRPAVARDSYGDCLALATARLNSNHPIVAHCSRRLGLMLVSLGDIPEALGLFERAARIAEISLGTEHPSFAGYLNDLAEAYRTVLNFRQARALYERALTLKERQLGRNHDSVATTVYNLALVSSDLGDLPEARRHFTRAMTIWQERLGADHPFVALAKASLAQTLRKNGNHREALILQREVLEVRERTLGTAHPDTADALADLASTLLALGRISDALPLSERAIGIWQEEGGAESPGLAAALGLRGNVLAASGDATGARSLYRRALAITERVFGREHPNTADLEVRLAAVAARTAEREAALGRSLAAEASARRFLQQALRFLPEREGVSYAARRPSGLNVALSIVVNSSSSRTMDLSQVFEAVIQNRALVFDEIAARRRAASTSPDERVAAFWMVWVRARQRLANLSMQIDHRSSGNQLTALQEARRDSERAERELAGQSSTWSVKSRGDDVTLVQVARALPQGAALLSFVRYDDPVSQVTAGVGVRTSRPSYVAFVIGPAARHPVLVPLGPADEIEKAVAEWRQLVIGGVSSAESPSRAEGRLRTVGNRLRRYLWDPIERNVESAHRIFIVPDGSLHLVSFAALPVGPSDYLIERGPLIHYLTSERDLVYFSRRPPVPLGGLLALGGAAFDATSTQVQSVVSTRSGCSSFQALQFSPLPGTRAEVDDVVSRWNESDHSFPARVLTGGGATEEAFKAEAPGHRILHLATHGFFLGGDCFAASPGTRAVGNVAGGMSAALVESPLLLSGLVLAGANRRAQAELYRDDGILTAEEVAAMNLDSVEWAVLSACDTGLGEIQAGEGVFGLRRAFQVAGAQTVIMSLWSVEDRATRNWMAALYEARLRRKLGTAESIREAGLTDLRQRRASGLTTHPFFWAAFVGTGNWV